MAPSSSLHLTSLRSVALGLLCGAALALAPACSCGPTKKCDAASCTGCCDSVGGCQAGLTANACGISGNLCTTCLIGQTCSAGTCTGGVGGGTGGAGGGFGGGGGSAGGGAAGGWGGGSGGGSGSVDAFINQVAPAYCAKLVSCGVVASGASGDCETLIKNMGFGNMARAVARGSRRMDSTAAAACVSGLSSATCDAVSTVFNDTCGKAFVPNASSGGACTSVAECVDPTQGCSGATYCTQTCGPTGGVGQACAGGGSCNPGAYCASGAGTYVCRAQVAAGNACPNTSMCDGDSTCSSGVCVALPQANQACRSAYPQCAASAYCSSGTCRLRKTQGTVCSYTTECASGLGCISGTCTPLLAVGVPCRSDDQCQSGLGCDDVLRTCQRYSYSVDAGAACTDTQRCRDFELDCRGLQVNRDGGVGTQGVCGATQPGDPCSWASDCGNATYCSGSPQGTCTPASLGSTCYSDRNCLSAHFCSSSTTPSTCSPRVASGQPCLERDQCVDRNETCFAFDSAPNDRRCRARGGLNAECSSSSSGTCLFPYECQAGRCVHAGLQGEPCITYAGCLNGSCIGPDGGAAWSGVCQQKQPLGGPCRMAWDCSSDECDPSGVCIAACL